MALGLRWRFREGCTFVQQRLCLGASAIEHDQRVAMLLQVRRHAAPHNAQPNKPDFHSYSFRQTAMTNSGW
jgi:hypothetical protein